MMRPVSRRRLLGGAAVVGGAALVGALGPTGTAQASPSGPRPWRNNRSANGWPVLPSVGRHTVEGSGLAIGLADGDPATILTYVARRFHYEIHPLHPGDIQAHTPTRQITETYESNYLSGSAIAIRPLAYPIGVRGGFYPRELVVLQDILADVDGAVVWGGNLDRPKESHFEIGQPPRHPSIRDAARRIATWTAGPGNAGAGTIDAFDPVRRAKARRHR